MTHVVTLICNPASPLLDDTILDKIAAKLPGGERPVWLARHVAADIEFEPADESDVRLWTDRIGAVAHGAPVDVIVQKRDARRKRLLLADMDSTMIGQECIDELADFAGLKPRVAAITERAMRGEIEFEPALRERVALLAGLDAAIIATIIAERITQTPGGRTLVATMQSNGAHAALVSGGFTAFTGPIATAIGFNDHFANQLIIEDGLLSGRVADPILGRAAKLATLIDLRQRFSLEAEQTLAVGDGANDLAMLQEAGLGVAYHAKAAVAAAAAARINFSDLSALLYVQGYHRDEFVQ
jgi:phosphoserine phosphatase